MLRTQLAVEQNDEYAAYIIDWLMPDMNGVEVVRRIRGIIGENKPIIILTGDGHSQSGSLNTADRTRPLALKGFKHMLQKLPPHPHTC